MHETAQRIQRPSTAAQSLHRSPLPCRNASAAGFAEIAGLPAGYLGSWVYGLRPMLASSRHCTPVLRQCLGRCRVISRLKWPISDYGLGPYRCPPDVVRGILPRPFLFCFFLVLCACPFF